MSASRDYCGDSNSNFYMPPDARAEALCDELRSAAREKYTDFCICKEAHAMLLAALANLTAPPCADLAHAEPKK